MEDEAVDVVGEVGERDLRLGARDADGADEQRHLVLLPGEHVLDAGTHGGSGSVGTRGARRHGLASGLLSMDAADPAYRLEPPLVGSTAIGGVGPGVGGGVIVGNDVAQHPPVEARAVGNLAAADEAVAPTDRDAALICSGFCGCRP